MRIITISREFGSGGRELRKRLAEKLCFACHDAEIIAAAAKSGLAESYVQEIVEHRHIHYYPISYGKTLQGANLYQYHRKGNKAACSLSCGILPCFLG